MKNYKGLELLWEGQEYYIRVWSCFGRDKGNFQGSGVALGGTSNFQVVGVALGETTVIFKGLELLWEGQPGAALWVTRNFQGAGVALGVTSNFQRSGVALGGTRVIFKGL